MYEFKNEDFEISDRKITGDLDSAKGFNDANPPATSREFLESVDKFLNLPGVEAIRWRQYTPYFADGDPCEFGVHDVYIRFSPLDDDEDERGDYEDGFVSEFDISYSRTDFPELDDNFLHELKTVTKEWDVLNKDEVCKRNFGDHSTVIATKEGFNVESYDHE